MGRRTASAALVQTCGTSEDFCSGLFASALLVPRSPRRCTRGEGVVLRRRLACPAPRLRLHLQTIDPPHRASPTSARDRQRRALMGSISEVLAQNRCLHRRVSARETSSLITPPNLSLPCVRGAFPSLPWHYGHASHPKPPHALYSHLRSRHQPHHRLLVASWAICRRCGTSLRAPRSLAAYRPPSRRCEPRTRPLISNRMLGCLPLNPETHVSRRCGAISECATKTYAERQHQTTHVAASHSHNDLHTVLRHN